MGKSISMDLRQRVLDFILNGHSCRAAAQHFAVGDSTAIRLAAAYRERGNIEPKRQGRVPGVSGKLAPYIKFLTDLVGYEPDMTLKELAHALEETYGVCVHPSSIHRALTRSGLSFKKKGLIAEERQRPEVKAARNEWTDHRLAFMRKRPEKLVFIDETATKTNMTRLYGRCPKGERLHGKAPLGSWNTQTFIAGLTSQAMIAPWVINGPMNRAVFDTYIETQLAPELEPGMVVIADNLSTHKSPKAAQILKDNKCWFLFLPAYSPDLNPIEMAFSKLKSHLRRIGARTIKQLISAIGDICDLFEPEECWNFFRAAGYASD